MKQDYPYISKEVLCRLFGKTRHAYYDHQWRRQDQSIKDDIILQLVHKLEIPLCRGWELVSSCSCSSLRWTLIKYKWAGDAPVCSRNISS